MPHNRSWLTRILGVLALVACAAIGAVALTGCTTPSGRPITPQAIAEMSDEEFEQYSERVGLWAQLAGRAAVKQGADVGKIIAYATALEAVTDPSADTLAAVAAQGGRDSLVAQLLLLEAEALLNARGGIPSGGRGLTLLKHIAEGARLGAAAGALERNAAGASWAGGSPGLG